MILASLVHCTVSCQDGCWESLFIYSDILLHHISLLPPKISCFSWKCIMFWKSNLPKFLPSISLEGTSRCLTPLQLWTEAAHTTTMHFSLLRSPHDVILWWASSVVRRENAAVQIHAAGRLQLWQPALAVSRRQRRHRCKFNHGERKHIHVTGNTSVSNSSTELNMIRSSFSSGWKILWFRGTLTSFLMLSAHVDLWWILSAVTGFRPAKIKTEQETDAHFSSSSPSYANLWASLWIRH